MKILLRDIETLLCDIEILLRDIETLLQDIETLWCVFIPLLLFLAILWSELALLS